jgi:hypothetical protein
MKHQSITFALLVLVAQMAWATDNPKFLATCRDETTHGYRAETDISGNPMEEAWTTNERFDSAWTFQYDGGGQILIDGKRGRVLAQHPGVLILSDVPFSNGIGAGVWTYAVQLGIQKIVASQVNAHGGLDRSIHGVKARSTNLACEFQFK